ncbi:ATP-binding protein [Terrimonas sp. NA20]|uniref:histidine kinase n=1 Tax=Terrimonas ginsenosidimutans TaxID=2908004 RepID=A0ABS9KWT5_9BACT|nr:ATP-binding protein [Terrimonas ginsenosidimutans]MCG2616806.1 ATP-binding protein [Terrimonas ginsenosidimutans]
MLPGNSTPATIPLQLFFCYNRPQKDILYTNTSIKKYFEVVADEQQTALFLHSGWIEALQLTGDREHSFTFTETNGKNYSCRVRSVTNLTGSGFDELLFCEVTCLHHHGKAADKEFEELINLASHDLDAPLRKLGVLIERLTGKIDPSGEGAAFVPRIEANIRDMRAMIDGLTKLASVNIPGPKEEIYLGELVKELIAECRRKHPGKSITLEINSLPPLKGDVLSIRMLFTNLLENAVIFSQNEQAFIQVSAVQASIEEMKFHSLQNGIKFYKITVQDHGIGFNRQDAEKIFRPFVRLHGKSAYPGSGLGLAVCKKIVENHQGLIYADATENEGARFILFLPQSLN